MRLVRWSALSLVTALAAVTLTAGTSSAATPAAGTAAATSPDVTEW